MSHDFPGASALVQEAIGELGVDAQKALANEGPNHRSWTLQRGSAAVLVTLTARDAGPGERRVYLRVISPMMSLPPATAREGLYRHLLELNAQGLANAAFGIVNDRVVAVSERPAEDMQREEVVQMLRHLAAVADTYDDRLVQAFGGELVKGKASKSL